MAETAATLAAAVKAAVDLRYSACPPTLPSSNFCRMAVTCRYTRFKALASGRKFRELEPLINTFTEINQFRQFQVDTPSSRSTPFLRWSKKETSAASLLEQNKTLEEKPRAAWCGCALPTKGGRWHWARRARIRLFWSRV